MDNRACSGQEEPVALGIARSSLADFGDQDVHYYTKPSCIAHQRGTRRVAGSPASGGVARGFMQFRPTKTRRSPTSRNTPRLVTWVNHAYDGKQIVGTRVSHRATSPGAGRRWRYSGH
jgi:hypothetical protein